MKTKFLLSIVSAFICVSALAQPKSKTVSVKPDSDSLFYSAIKYRQAGPFRGGRSAAVTGSYKNKNTFYFGATGGGVWKTTDGGSNWKNISDKYFWWQHWRSSRGAQR